jgi:hypothetical protein
MALVLDATPFSPTANSYATVAEANAYHEAHLYATDWDAADVSQKTIALVMATRILDYKVEWAHYPTKAQSEGQVLQWPRTGLIDLDGYGNLDDDTIPQRIKEVTAEYARQLLVSNRTADSDVETQGISSISAGPISLSFKETVKAKVVPDAVVQMIPTWWGRIRGNALTWAVLRG